MFKNVDKPRAILYTLCEALADLVYVEQDRAVVSSLVAASGDVEGGGGNERDQEGRPIDREARGVDAGGGRDRPGDPEQGVGERKRYADGVAGEATPLVSGGSESLAREGPRPSRTLREQSGEHHAAE